MGPTPAPVDPMDHFAGPNWLDLGLLNVGTVFFFAGAIIELAFLVHYVIVAPAFKSWIGVMFVVRSTSFLLAGLAILLGRVLGPDYPFRPYVTVALFLLVLASACVTYGTFLRERYKDGPTKGNPFHRFHTFARRALGLRGRRARRPHDADAVERPLRIVKDRNA